MINFEKFERDILIYRLVDYCESVFDLSKAKLGDEYFYQSITSCIIDAIFSIGITYDQTKKVVESYNEYFNLKIYRSNNKYPSILKQDSIDDLIKRYDNIGIEKMANDIYKNRCRTSTHKNSILKSEAVYLFALLIKKYGINYLQDIRNIINNKDFEYQVRKIPGQTTGISLDYFYMLSGDETFVKVDRMMIRFFENAIGYIPDKYQIRQIIIDIVKILNKKFPNLTPRILDHQIWLYQRNI